MAYVKHIGEYTLKLSSEHPCRYGHCRTLTIISGLGGVSKIDLERRTTTAVTGQEFFDSIKTEKDVWHLFTIQSNGSIGLY